MQNGAKFITGKTSRTPRNGRLRMNMGMNCSAAGRANRLRRWRRRAISKCPGPPVRMRCGWRRSMRGVGADRCMASNLYEPDRAIVAIRVR